MPDILGHKISKPAAIAIAGGSGLAIWFAYRQHKDSAGTSTSASAIDPITQLPYSQDQVTDPLTGETYLAEAQEYGSVAAAEQAVAGESSLDYSSAYGTGTGAAGTSAGTTGTTTTGSTGYASNAAWAQAAEAGLTDVGYTSTDIAAALGRYLGNLSETAAQATIVDAAIAEYGPPPDGTYTVILAPVTTPTGSGSTGTGTSSGTGSTGTGTGSTGTTPAAGGPITAVPSGFRVVSVSGLNVTLGWNPLTPPAGQGPLTGYTVAYGQSPDKLPYTQQAGVGANGTTITFNPGAGSQGLTHYFELWADPASSGGPHAGPIAAKTA
jgi:hypothetical protein